MSRRSRYAVSRSVTFASPAALALGGWITLRDPAGWAGLGAMIAAALIAGPVLILAFLFFVPAALAGGLVPRRWRIRYRQRHGRENARSAYISTRLRRAVFAADRHRCVYCRRGHGLVILNVDHIRPWAGGGLTTLFNLMTLCHDCNMVKLNYWRDRDGYVHYRKDMRTPDRLARAAAILACERRRRLSPLRFVRAAWALG